MSVEEKLRMFRLLVDMGFTEYHEHALEQGSDSKAVAYIRIRDNENNALFGAGVDTNISIASFRAVVCALNRSAIVARHIDGRVR